MPIEKVGGNSMLFGGGGAASLAAPDMLPALRTGPLQSPFLKGESSSYSSSLQQKNQKPHLILKESSSASKCCPKQSQSSSLQLVSSPCTSPASATTLPTKIVMANGRILYRPIPIKPVRPQWLQERLLQQQTTGQQRSATAATATAATATSGVVPEQVVQDFYDTAASQGLSEEQVHEAAVQAAEWHRKWTMQDERNHTAPEQQQQLSDQQHTTTTTLAAAAAAAVVVQEEEETAKTPTVVPQEENEQASISESIQTTTTPFSPTTTALFADDYHCHLALVLDADALLMMTADLEHARHLACNPSPEEEQDETTFSSAARFLLSESCDSSSTTTASSSSPQQEESSDQNQNNRPVYKRRFSETCHLIPDNEQITSSQDNNNNIATGGGPVLILRPVPVRIVRPQAIRPMDYYYRQFHLAGPAGEEADDDVVVDALPKMEQEEEQPTQHSNNTIPKSIGTNWRTNTTRCGSGHLSPLTLSSLGTLDESKNSSKRNRTASPTRRLPSVPVMIEQEELEYEHEHHQQVINICIPPAESVVLISSTEQMLRDKDRSLPTEIIHTNRHRSCHRLTACNNNSTSNMSEAADSDDSSLSCRSNATDVMEARDGLLHALAIQGGAVPVKADGSSNSTRFYECLEVLQEQFADLAADTRHGNDPFSPTVEGCWLTLTSPTYFGCLGLNDNADPMYTLGRMAFDMFSPTSLVCSLQGNFNTVHAVSDANRAALLADSSVPKALREEVELGATMLRTYNVVTAFTIEPNLAAYPTAPNKDVRRPIRGLMTTYGYTLPDPEIPNRHSVWITGGRIEPNNDPKDQAEWKAQFAAHPPKHGLTEQAKLLAIKLLMGAQIAKEMNPEDGSMEYTFSRPLGGHGLAFIDVLYVDESLRVVRGHRGTIFCFSRLPGDHSP